jgi:UDP-GlcNAc:undecaprenyl-phosphate GlcNAc-1-phosphate transferase
MEYAFVFLLLIAFMLLYFRLASGLNIIDKPNERSSHVQPTIRGGGVVFCASVCAWFLLEGFAYPFLIAGTLLIAIVSFADDIKPLPNSLRIGMHLAAFGLLSWQLALFNEPWWIIALVFIIGIGALNAFNFMDGINGITGTYALVTLVTLLAIDRWVVHFTRESLILFLMMGVLVFLIYNFRYRARCFAGDVGSITLAFLLCFLLLQLILQTANYGWIVLFVVYGVDTVVTIVYRLLQKENIFQAHRSHVYQYLVNELGYTHLAVSVFYALVQAGINVLVILYLPHPALWQGLIIIALTGFIYVWIRERILGKLGKRGLLSLIAK